MSTPCFNHPTVAAVGSCVQCGTPGCAQCLQQVAGKTVCQRCVAAIRARLEPQVPPAAPAPGAYGSPYGGPATGFAPPYAPAQAAPPKTDAKQVLLGMALGAVIGVIGAILLEKLLVYGHFGLSLLYVFLGYGIGWGIHRVTGRGGPGLGLAAVGVMVFSLLVSHLVLAQDVLSAAQAGGRADSGVTLLDAFPQVLGRLGIMHWVCILIGLGACYRGMEQQG